jgi:hypothetical protein
MERFVNNILPQVPGSSKTIIEQEVLRIAIEFCQNSLIWQTATEKTVAATASTFTLGTETDSQIADCYVFLNEVLYEDYTRSEAVVTLYDAVTAETDFDTISFLKPTEDADDLPDILYHDWFEGIAAGAKSRLQMMPGKKWTSLKLAAINQALYQHNLNHARVKARMTGIYTEFTIKRDTNF